jgi:hypothetical protein
MPIVQNFPGPYEVRLYYTTAPSGLPAFTHQARYNVSLFGAVTPGLAFSAYDATPRAGALIPLSTVVDNWVALMRPLIGSGGGNTIDYAELWKYTPGTFQATFWGSYGIGLAGTSGGAVVAASQLIQTYRTVEGGIMRINVMEGTLPAAGIDGPPFSPAQTENVRGGIIGASNCWLGRDTSQPMAAIGQYVGQNEALFKKRYR